MDYTGSVLGMEWVCQASVDRMGHVLEGAGAGATGKQRLLKVATG